MYYSTSELREDLYPGPATPQKVVLLLLQYTQEKVVELPNSIPQIVAKTVLAWKTFEVSDTHLCN